MLKLTALDVGMEELDTDGHWEPPTNALTRGKSRTE